MNSVGKFCLWLLGLAVVFTVVRAQEWPHYLGPNFDLKPQASKFAATKLTQVWRTDLNTGMCSITVADGLLYTMGNDGTTAGKGDAIDTVYCLDASTGKIKWTFDYPCALEPRLHPGGPSATPTIHDGKVYTISKFGQIFCLDAKTGKKIWEASAADYKPKKAWWGFAGSPTVIGDLVIFNVGDRGLALNKNSGEVAWKSENSVVGYATPKPLPETLFGRPAVALFTNEDFLVVDPETGRSIATYPKSWREDSNCNAITPYVYKGHFYLVHSKHGLARLSLEGNQFKQDWLSEEGGYDHEWHAFNTHVIHGGNIYYLVKGRRSDKTGLNCIDAETGQRKSFDSSYEFGNSLLVGNTMIMLSESGELIWGELSKASFQEKHRQKIMDGLCWANPVLLGNLLYARNAEGTVVCVKVD